MAGGKIIIHSILIYQYILRTALKREQQQSSLNKKRYGILRIRTAFIFLISIRGLKDKDKMTLTKKHFKAVAEILSKHNANKELIAEFSQYFKTENSLFNAEKFYTACFVPN